MKISSLKSKLPKLAGIYFFKDKRGKTIYIGKAIDLSQRVNQYFQKPSNLEPKMKKMVAEAACLDYIPVESEFEALLLEAKLIKKERPKYNSKWRDDKSFLYALVTDEEYPRVLAARKTQGVKGTYFGPFPKAVTVRRVLKFLRFIFPYCSQKLTSQTCFYSYLGLCNPCPSKIVKLAPEKQIKARKAYLLNISRLKRVLFGQARRVIADLEVQMREKAKKEKFEEAKILRDQIEKLKYITSLRNLVSSYLENPNFLEDQRLLEVRDLRKILGPYFGEINLSRIECFDISTLFGQKGAGSMVVFLEGIEEKSQYRRFRIRKAGKPDDVAMIREVIKRRLAHPEWAFPDLIIIDGGKGQVSAVLGVLRKLQLKIPVVGLAKRLEEIIIPKEAGFETLKLPLSSTSLNLLKRARDEAHRFAIAYHKKLRRELI